MYTHARRGNSVAEFCTNIMSMDDESRLDTRWSGTFHDRGRRSTYEILLAPSGVIYTFRGLDAKAAAVLLAPDVEPTISKTEMAVGMGTDVGRLTSAVRNVALYAPHVGVEIRDDSTEGIYEVVPSTSRKVVQRGPSYNGINGSHHNGVRRRVYPSDPRAYSVRKGTNRIRHVASGPRGAGVERNISKW